MRVGSILGPLLIALAILAPMGAAKEKELHAAACREVGGGICIDLTDLTVMVTFAMFGTAGLLAITASALWPRFRDRFDPRLRDRVGLGAGATLALVCAIATISVASDASSICSNGRCASYRGPASWTFIGGLAACSLAGLAYALLAWRGIRARS